MESENDPMNSCQQSNLATSAIGTYECIEIDVEGDASVRMKQLGLCAGRRIHLLAAGDPMILRIGETEIGLSRDLARRIRVCRAPHA